MAAPLYQSIIEDGAFRVISSYDGKHELLALMHAEIIPLIGEMAGEKAADAVKAEGLPSMHKHVSPDIIPELQRKLEEKIRPAMLRLTRDFGIKELGLPDDFFLDLKVIVRIKFPFAIASKSTVTYADYSRAQGRTKSERPIEITAGYHNNLPFPAWAHGPHQDSWWGHSFDGINLWWGIDGVNEKSGMVFYPDIVGDETLPVLPEPPYLAKNYPLPKPTFFNLTPGEVIVFNSDTLHATRVNESDVTRVSLSTRINPGVPRFNPKHFRHVRYWVQAKNVDAMLQAALPSGEQSISLKNSRFDSAANPYIYEAAKEDHGNERGVLGDTCKKGVKILPTFIESKETFAQSGTVHVGSSDMLKVGEKALVTVGGEKIVMGRTPQGIYALGAVSPYLGYNLGLGGHTETEVYDPGHGLAIKWKDGTSGSGFFKVPTYGVKEKEGGIFLTRSSAR